MNLRRKVDLNDETRQFIIRTPNSEGFGNWQTVMQVTLASILVGQLMILGGENCKKR